MENFGIPKNDGIKKRSVEQESYVEGSIEDVKDVIFDEFMKQQLIEDFFHTLEDFLDKSDIDTMRKVLVGYKENEIYAALSLPHELRERKFAEFAQKINSGIPASNLMSELVEASSRYQFGVGYHTSPYDIKPDASGRWNIKGTERDHRDDDRMMAYYSKKYRHLFKKKNPAFVYIVRTEPQTHKTDGNWSRAGELSVVAQVSFEKVFDFVEKTSRNLDKKSREA
jgi:hypothetical protein